MKNFNKQFLISNLNIEHKVLDNNYYRFNNINVIVNKNLKCIYTKDKNNKYWLVLGVVLTLNERINNVKEEIEKTYSLDILKLTNFWSGRWVLICNEGVYGDASHLLGIYYNVTFSGIFYISSSISVISELLKIKKSYFFNTSKPPESYILPGSGYNQIQKLNVGKYFCIKNKEEKVSPISIYYDYSNLEYKVILTRIDELLNITFKRIEELSYKKVLLALTSGYDSRLLLSYALKHNKSKLEVYHQERIIVNKKDYAIAKKISLFFNLNFSYIKRKGYDRKLEEKFDIFCGCQTKDADRSFYSNGQWNFGSKDTIVVRGGIFGIGKMFYFSKLDALGDNQNNLLNYLKNKLNLSSSNQEHNLEKWVDFYKQTYDEYSFIDYRDRFYIEQREAGWLASIEQGLDIQEKDSIHPMNNRLLISYLSSLDENTKIDYKHHIDLIKINTPDQLKFPFNPKITFLNRVENGIKVRIKKYLKINSWG